MTPSVAAVSRIIPTIAAAFETYPELDVADVLDRCTAALTEKAARRVR